MSSLSPEQPSSPSAAGDPPPLRHAPHNIEAEQALLGAILVNNECHDRVSSFLLPEHFYEGLHARIYDATSHLIRMGKCADPITLKAFFEQDATLNEIGGIAYLAQLAASATTILNVTEYGRSIHELSIRRSLIDLGTTLVNSAFEAKVQENSQDLIEQTEQSLFSLAEKGKYGQGFTAFPHALVQAIEMAAAAYHRDGGLSGVSSGLKDLDEKMGGLQPSDLIILAGRPAMGKTALATNIAYRIARAYEPEERADGSMHAKNGGVVAFFSLEMSSEQLATRILSEQAEISSERIRRGKIDEKDFRKLIDVSREMETLPLYIDATGGLSIAQVAARARRLKRQKGIGLIVIDYLQLLTGSAKRSQEGRVQEISEITTSLKALAKELNVPILALSQLSRQVENRDDKRPQLADLRESGSIEQDADVVLFIYRDEYYLARKEPKPNTEEHQKWQDEMDSVTNIAEVIIGKQRHGPTGTVRLHFNAMLTKFDNLAQENHFPEHF